MLMFCSSRKGCESTAKHIAKFLKKFPVSPHNDQSDPFDVSSAIESLRRSPAGLDPILEETLPLGVAYHHAGLTVCLAVLCLFLQYALIILGLRLVLFVDLCKLFLTNKR